MSTVQTELGQKIRQLRGDMSQAALAAAVGLDQSTLSRIESGERAVQLDELFELATHLGVEVTALLADDEPVFALRADADADVLEALEACSLVIDDFFSFEALVGSR